MEGYAVISLINEEGFPAASTVTISKADGINWLSFIAGTNDNKANRIRANSKACVCLASSKYNIRPLAKITHTIFSLNATVICHRQTTVAPTFCFAK